MWLSLASKLVPGMIKTGMSIATNRRKAKELQSVAEMRHAEKMATGELEYKAQVLKSNDQGIKDDIVLLVVILPIVVLAYGVFSGDPQAKEKLDLFFEYFNNFPEFYKWLVLGIFGSIYGLKPGMDLFKKEIMSDNLDLINEYKDQVRILKNQISELEDASKSKDSANKRCLQKLEHSQQDLEQANKKITELEDQVKKLTKKDNE